MPPGMTTYYKSKSIAYEKLFMLLWNSRMMMGSY